MARDIGSIYVQIGAKTSKLEQAYSRVQRKTQQLRGRLERINNITRKFTAVSKRAGVALAGLSAALGVAATRTAAYADEIDKMSVRTGIAREELQELRHASNILGVEFSGLERPLTRLGQRLTQDAGKSTQAGRAIAQLGIETRDANGEMREMTDLFEDSIDLLAGMESEVERNALAMELFGRSGRDLIPFLAAGGDEINRLRKEARDLGLVIGDQTVRDLTAFHDELNTTRDRLGMAGREITMQFVPAIRVVLGWVNELVDWFQSLDNEQKQQIAQWTAITGAILTAVTIFGLIVTAAALVVKGLLVLGTVFAIVLSPMMLGFILITAAAMAIYTAWQKVSDLKLPDMDLPTWEDTWSAVKKLPGQAVEIAKQTIENVSWPELPGIDWHSSWDTVSSFVSGKVDSARERIRETEWPSLPEFSWPSIPKFSWPEIPEINWPSLPKFTWPEVPSFSWPSLPEFDWPSIPEFSWPEIPKISWPSLPEFSWPSIPEFSWPKIPQINWPEVPKFSWPSIPKFEWPQIPEISWPSLPEFSWPEIPKFTWPQIPQFDWPSVPEFQWPSLPSFSWPDIPKFEWPEIPSMSWPSIPEFNWPAMPRFEWPSIPEFSWPSVPQFSWPDIPRFSWPSIPAFEWPEIPKPEFPAKPELEWPELQRFEWPDIPEFEWPEIPALEMPELPTYDFASVEMPNSVIEGWKTVRGYISDFGTELGKIESETPTWDDVLPERVIEAAERIAQAFAQTPIAQGAKQLSDVFAEFTAGELTVVEAIEEALKTELRVPLLGGMLTLMTGGKWRLLIGISTLAMSLLPEHVTEGIKDTFSAIVATLQRAWEQWTNTETAGEGINLEWDTEIDFDFANVNWDNMLTGIGVLGGQIAAALSKAIEESLDGRVLNIVLEVMRVTLQVTDWVITNVETLAVGFLASFGSSLQREINELREEEPSISRDIRLSLAESQAGATATPMAILGIIRTLADRFAGTTESIEDSGGLLENALENLSRAVESIRRRMTGGGGGGGNDNLMPYSAGTTWTGGGPLSEVAGVVHRREAVIPWSHLKHGIPGILEFFGASGFQGGTTGAAGDMTMQIESAGADLEGLDSSLNQMLSTLTESFTGFFSWLGQFLLALGEKFLGAEKMETLSGLWDEATSRFEDLMNAFKTDDIEKSNDDAADETSKLAETVSEQVSLWDRINKGLHDSLTALTAWGESLLRSNAVIGSAMSAFEQATAAPDDGGMGLGMAGGIASAALAILQHSETFQQIMDILNPLIQAAADAFGMLLEPIIPIVQILSDLLGPMLAVVGQILATLIEPVLRLLFIVLQGFGIALMFIAEVFQRVRAWILDAVGSLVYGLGAFVDALVGWLGIDVGQDLMDHGEALQEGAQDARDSADQLAESREELTNLTYDEAMAKGKATDTTEEMNDQLRNVPSGFKIALSRFNVADPIPMATGGIVTRATNAIVGEAGPEAVIPLDEGGIGGTTIVVKGDVYGYDDFRKKVNKAMSQNKRSDSLARFGLGGGGA